MLRRITSFFTKIMQKYLPDPFIFALLLSVIVFILGIVLNGETPFAMVKHWGNGFWGFLGFSMQITLILIFGTVLANAPIFKRGIKRIAGIPKTPTQAVVFVTIVAGISCMIQWAFGLVIGAIVAREVAKRVKGVDYGLLIASAFSTFLLTVFTGTINLKAASNLEELKVVTLGALTEVVPMSEAAYHPVTLITILILIITFPIVNAKMHPKKEDTISIDPSLLVDEDEISIVIKPNKTDMTPAERIENSSILSLMIFLAGGTYVFNHFFLEKLSLNMDIMIMILLFLGILLHRKPIAYIKAVRGAVGTSAGIILQYPFYAGIMGMMSGLNPVGISLAGIIAGGIISLSTKVTYPIFTFLSAGLVNFFVPSGGGQWAVQAPIVYPAGLALGVDPAITTMAFGWGDAWTNMVQPFWALPALAIAGLNAKDIMGYLVTVWLWAGIVITGGLLVWSVLI